MVYSLVKLAKDCENTMMQNYQTSGNFSLKKEKIYQFLDAPTTNAGRLVKIFIIFLIILSGLEFLSELFLSEYLYPYAQLVAYLDKAIVTVFTLEYLIRLWATPSRKKFIVNFYNIIDLLAIVPYFFLALNLSFFRTFRLVRLFRIARLFRAAKIMRHFWYIAQLKMGTVARVVQENVLKNMVVIILLIFLVEPTRNFLVMVNPNYYSDIILATSIFGVAAMFGFFSLSYGDVDPLRLSDRMLAHVTSAFLMLPIGIMFMIVEIILTKQLGQSLGILSLAIWLVYTAIVLWDFSNVKKIQKNFTEERKI